MLESLAVNPESIEPLDYISTPHGIGRVGWVNNEKGYLAYAPVNDLNDKTYTKELAIRSVRLLTKHKPTSGEQLSLSFVTEQVEAAIYERNQRLNELRDATFSKAKPRSTEPKAPAVKKTMTSEDKELLQLLSKLSKDDLKKLGL
jgi:hypothetical protein